MTKLAKVAVIAACGAVACFAGAGVVMAAGKEADAGSAKGSKKDAPEAFGVNVDGTGVSVNLPGLRVNVDGSGVAVDGAGGLLEFIGDSEGKRITNLGGTWISGEPMKSVSLERSLQAAGIRSIRADGAFADVVLAEGSGNAIRCAFAGKVSADAADGVTLALEADSGVARATLAWPEGKRHGASADCVLRIEVPKGTSFDLVEMSSASGDLSIGSVRAETCELSATSGDVSVGRLSADSLRIRCVSGDVRVDGTPSRDIGIVATSGDVVVIPAPGFGYSYSLGVSSGEIRADDRRTDGPAKLTGSLGDGKGSLVVECASGDVTVSAR